MPGASSVYNAVGPWTITQDGVTLVGTGRENARIDFSAGVGDGIVFTDVDYFGIENVNVRNAAGSGVVVQGSTTGVYATRGYINKCVSLANGADGFLLRSEEHTSELQSLMRISYAVFCLKRKTYNNQHIA